MIYYAIQSFESEVGDSALDKIWQTRTKWHKLDDARKDFRAIWMTNPYTDYRVVRAFVNPKTKQERILEVIEIKRGKTRDW